MKCLSNFITILIIFSCFKNNLFLCESLAYMNNPTNPTNQNNQNNFNQENLVPHNTNNNNNIFWEGYISYIHLNLDDKRENKPTNFYTNKKGDHHSLFHFYAKLFQKELQIYTTKNSYYIHDVLQINTILSNRSDSLNVLNLGDFEEGSCLQVKTENKISENKNKINWIICNDLKKNRDLLLQNLIHLNKSKNLHKNNLKLNPQVNIEKKQEEVILLETKANAKTNANAKFETLISHKKDLEKKLRQKEQEKLLQDLEIEQQKALKEINREISNQKLIEIEILLKSEEETRELLQLKEHEEKKQKLLLKIIKDQEVQNESTKESFQNKLKLEKIKIDTEKEVAKKRVELKKKIEEIKLQAERRKNEILNDISNIKSQIAINLSHANKIGNKEICKESFKYAGRRDEYCSVNYIENQLKIIECKDENNFCFLCCENEFGSMHIEKRKECYDMCDKIAFSEEGKDHKKIELDEFLI